MLPTEATGEATRLSGIVNDKPLIVLVDDVRIIKDGRAQFIARTPDEVLDILDRLGDKRIDRFWLDFDIIGGTVEPVVDRLVRMAETGHPADVRRVCSLLTSAGRAASDAGAWRRRLSSREAIRPRHLVSSHTLCALIPGEAVMTCTDPEFAESMRRGSADDLFGENVPFTAEELDAAAAPAMAMSQLADAIVASAQADRRRFSVKRRED